MWLDDNNPTQNMHTTAAKPPPRCVAQMKCLARQNQQEEKSNISPVPTPQHLVA